MSNIKDFMAKFNEEEDERKKREKLFEENKYEYVAQMWHELVEDAKDAAIMTEEADADSIPFTVLINTLMTLSSIHGKEQLMSIVMDMFDQIQIDEGNEDYH